MKPTPDRALTLAALKEHLNAHPGNLTRGVLEELMNRFAPEPEELAPYVRFDPINYRRNPVPGTGPHYQLIVICWCPGQRSPIHDHRGSVCAVFVASGTATETLYDVDDPTAPCPTTSRRLPPGSITISFDRDAHHIAAADGPLCTVHLYAPRLQVMTLYPDASS